MQHVCCKTKGICCTDVQYKSFGFDYIYHTTAGSMLKGPKNTQALAINDEATLRRSMHCCVVVQTSINAMLSVKLHIK